MLNNYKNKIPLISCHRMMNKLTRRAEKKIRKKKYCTRPVALWLVKNLSVRKKII